MPSKAAVLAACQKIKELVKTGLTIVVLGEVKKQKFLSSDRLNVTVDEILRIELI